MVLTSKKDRLRGESVVEFRARLVCDAAERVFLEHGYDGASMELVAAAAGVTKKTLYNYFRSKDELFAAVIGQLCDTYLLQLHDIGDPMAAPIEDELTAFCMAIVQRSAVSPNIDFFRLAINVAKRFPKIGGMMRRVGLARVDKALQAYLDQQVAAGRLTIDNTDFAARYLIGMISTFLFQGLLGAKMRPNADATRRYVRGAVRLFCAGYRVSG